MPAKINADIQNGYYGTYSYDSKSKTQKFIPLGKAVTIIDVFENLENRELFYRLSWDYNGHKKTMRVPRGDVYDNRLLGKLTAQGADIPVKNYSVFLDSIRMQEADRESNAIPLKFEYDKLGWYEIPDKKTKGDTKLLYRHSSLIGGVSAEYRGDYNLTLHGTFDGWKELVNEYVIGRTALELILLASLAAIPNGLLVKKGFGENPIVHINGTSGSGKTTAAYLAATPYGKPFEGTNIAYDSDGQPVVQKSILQSWGATENAVISDLAGNCGVVTILNELGKFTGSNMTRVIFDLSEGSDKKRMTTTLSERYSTVIISTGEASLLDKCKDKFEGLRVRVIELDDILTDSAEHSNILKELSLNNCGHAAPIMAKYILENGGVDYVYTKFKKWKDGCNKHFEKTYNSERFVEKFAALFLATSEIAYEALDIKFSTHKIIEYLYDFDKKHGVERDAARESYDLIIEDCNINRACFYSRSAKHQKTSEKYAIKDCYGRITATDYIVNGRRVVEEIELFPEKLKEILDNNGFSNLKTCITAWKKMNVLDCESGHNFQRRCIAPNSKAKSKVYVFRVFADDNAEVAND